MTKKDYDDFKRRAIWHLLHIAEIGPKDFEGLSIFHKEYCTELANYLGWIEEKLPDCTYRDDDLAEAKSAIEEGYQMVILFADGHCLYI
jgi:prepilin-type processing-associated H-X9-DG protein